MRKSRKIGTNVNFIKNNNKIFYRLKSLCLFGVSLNFVFFKNIA